MDMDACDPWRGSREWYQYEARRVLKVERHLWITNRCQTPMCLSGTHLVTLKPAPLDYLAGVCVYCGLLADTRDHLMPKGWSGDVARSFVLTVPACRECNTTIGAQWAPTITERRAVAHRGIRRKYRKIVTRRRMTRDEIDELGPNLRSVIDAQEDLVEALRMRLAWPPDHAYDFGACERAGFPDPYEVGLLLPQEVLA